MTEAKGPLHGIRVIDLGRHQVSTTVSAGIAVFPNDGEDPETLIRNADLAMYRAKRESGSGWRFFSRELGERVAARLRMEADLARALERAELELHYQPRFATSEGRLVACEALVRWRREGRLTNAAEFIGVAEDTGLILDIGRFVLDEACRQAAAWRAAGSPVRVAVNLSGRQIREGEYNFLFAADGGHIPAGGHPDIHPLPVGGQ